MAQATGDSGTNSCGSITNDGFYRIRNCNPKLCLALGKVGEEDSDGELAVYAAEQEDVESQKWRVQLDANGDGYVIESGMSAGFYMGFAVHAKYTQIIAQESKTKWYLGRMFGSAHTIVEASNRFSVGFSDYLPDAGDDAVLIDNVGTQSEIWYFEPWDVLKKEKRYQPTTDTSLQDGKYQIVNVATGFLMTVNDRPGVGGWYITKQKAERVKYKVWTLKRNGNKVTLYNADIGVYASINTIVPVVQAGSAENFVLGKQKGERGFYIMSESETEPRQVFADNRQTPEGFEFYAADIKKYDPTQRWEFKPFS